MDIYIHIHVPIFTCIYIYSYVQLIANSPPPFFSTRDQDLSVMTDQQTQLEDKLKGFEGLLEFARKEASAKETALLQQSLKLQVIYITHV